MVSRAPGRVHTGRWLALVGVCLWPFGALAQGDGLEVAMRSALRLHPAVAGQQAQLEAKAYGSDAARSLRYPTLTAQAQQYGSAPRSDTGGSSTPVTLRARQALWAFGRIDSQIAYADADTQTERADLRRVQRQLVENTALAYAAVLGSRQRLQLAVAHSGSLQSLHGQIQRREQGQLASRADVSLAATRLAQARARQPRYEAEWEVALSDLQALTQQAMAAEQPVAPHLTSLPAHEVVLEMALARSAELGHKQQLVERARAAVEQVRTSALPTVYLQAERLYGQSVGASGGGADSRVSVVLEGSLEGMGFAARGQTQAAQAQLSAAQQDLLSARNDTDRNVKRLTRQRQMLQELMSTQAASLLDLGALVDSYKRQYEAGTKSWLDVLNTQREMNEQQLQQVQTGADWLAQSLQLAALIGRFDMLIDNGKDGAGE